MYKRQTVTVDKMVIPIEGERNLLELVRKARIELPTFCYHSDMSVYGACRMCMVEVEGNGVIPACSTPPADGMIVKTNTKQLRDMRKMIIELMLANHDQNCTTCPKSGDCKLQKIARQMGIDKVRFQQVNLDKVPDLSSDAIIRDPSKCVLCGDCVRVCEEIQSVGVLDFANRGADAEVVACFDKGLGEVECVNCGQCVKVCPVGALIPKSQINEVWDALHDEEKYVVVQIAPAVRVALGEYFGYRPGTTTTGQIVTALRLMGFDQVFDTAFTADLTVIEEGNEFLERVAKGENLPQFTSCCPAWVKFAEQYYPDMLPNLSSCRSPQQMFGSVVKDHLTEELQIPRDKLVVVSIMPCTAKKFEANRPEFSVDGNKDVDYVLTTQELSLMIRERGLTFSNLEPGSFDMPYGFKTGAGVIFGNSGGVSEAVLRYAADTLSKGKGMKMGFTEISTGGAKTLNVTIGDKSLRLAIVSGLASARELIDKVRTGEEYYDLIEVMACCGGCVNGGGQPITEEKAAVESRARELFDNDKMLQFHSSHENPYIKELYEVRLTPEKAHELLHTKYSNRKRIQSDDVALTETDGDKSLKLNICFGTSCFLRGAQDLYTKLIDYLREEDLEQDTEFTASFCTERCKRGPVLQVNGKILEHCTYEMAVEEIQKAVH
ncbi:MAG TPA: [FeFe] hydrogenase, group A [Anaerovoracaceae bacterium]|nr:[FeFe] hydrogenase, group A [Anaerovoracaceae bacterium]